MFWQKKQDQPELLVASCLGENSYSIAAVTQDKRVLFCQHRVFNDNAVHQMAKSLADDVDRFNLITHSCQLILLPGQYQLILMDALDVPEADMAKALRWSLKGYSDYDLDDVAIDVFLLPLETGDQKKALVALTPLSILNKKRAVYESAFLEITVVSIAEIALKKVLTLMRPSTPNPDEAPIIVITICDTIRKLHIVYQDQFCLIRDLSSSARPAPDEPAELADIIGELERSIDYCVNKLNLPEPKQLFFTPGFHRAVDYFQTIKEKLALDVSIIDLNDYLKMESPLSLEVQHEVFYSIAGAL